MDKRVMLAVAGSGKTTYIVNNLSKQKHSLIVTYTDANYANLYCKIIQKFRGEWPENITLMTYFTFLFRFCYKPFLSDQIRAKGLCYEPNQNKRIPQNKLAYYMTKTRYLYSNRLALLLEKLSVIEDIKARIETYFDEFIIDEVQDIAGRDFTLLEHLMKTNINMLFVGDFFQHTFDTSRDGNVNASLHKNINTYKQRFSSQGLTIDADTLKKSWRCSKSVCDYVRTTLGVDIFSARSETDDTSVVYISDEERIADIIDDMSIVKLHYQNAALFGLGHKNWGQTKGEDNYADVCIMLNKTTATALKKGMPESLAPSTKNKLYVALTRAKGNVYLIDEN
ncbi:hypothetical protein [Clostridium phoceensis]|uniref:hypothetical protein n=1 Tax=Clostridium phoceensis TaxID=1650661 RepID=UPI002E780EDB|nr:hypothetical protein [Clostridium phoceensis]